MSPRKSVINVAAPAKPAVDNAGRAAKTSPPYDEQEVRRLFNLQPEGQDLMVELYGRLLRMARGAAGLPAIVVLLDRVQGKPVSELDKTTGDKIDLVEVVVRELAPDETVTADEVLELFGSPAAAPSSSPASRPPRSGERDREDPASVAGGE